LDVHDRDGGQFRIPKMNAIRSEQDPNNYQALKPVGGTNHSGTGRVLDYDDFANIRIGSEAEERGYRGYFRYIPDSGQWLSAL